METFKITIEIPDELIREAVSVLLRRSFSVPQSGYSSDGNEGFKAVARQVKHFVEAMDFTEYIQRAAKIKMEDVVGAVVEAELRTIAKKKAKQMTGLGTLFDSNVSAGVAEAS